MMYSPTKVLSLMNFSWKRQEVCENVLLGKGVRTENCMKNVLLQMQNNITVTSILNHCWSFVNNVSLKLKLKRFCISRQKSRGLSKVL